MDKNGEDGPASSSDTSHPGGHSKLQVPAEFLGSNVGHFRSKQKGTPGRGSEVASQQMCSTVQVINVAERERRP